VACVRRWPVHPQPRKDELLSSWLQELARGNGQKLQAFSDCVFGTDHQIWNRDVDRLAPRWLRANLVRHTGVPRQSVAATTLDGYRGNFIEREISLVNFAGYCRYKCSIVNTSDLVCSTVRNVCSKMMSHIFAGDGEWLTANFVPDTVFSSEIGAGGAGSQ
jgi:TniQ